MLGGKRLLQRWAVCLVMVLACTSAAQARAPRKLLAATWSQTLQGWFTSLPSVHHATDTLSAFAGDSGFIEVDDLQSDEPMIELSQASAPVPARTLLQDTGLATLGSYGTYGGGYGDSSVVEGTTGRRLLQAEDAGTTPGSYGGYGSYGSYGDAVDDTDGQGPVRRLLQELADEGVGLGPGSYGGYGYGEGSYGYGA
jgi:hypothetical protein